MILEEKMPEEHVWSFGKASVEEAIAAIGRGEVVCVVDDEDRENEGDFIIAAEKATKATLAFMIRCTQPSSLSSR